MGRRRRSHRQGTLFKRGGRGPWVAQWYDHAGKRILRSTGTTDRAAAERILAKRVADAALRRDGVVDARADGYATAERQPLSEHITDWRAHLAAKGVTEKQIKNVTRHVETLVTKVKAERPSDLSASAIQAAIGEFHKAGKSLQTCQHYLRAIKQFSRWLRRDGRVRDDALAHLTGYNAATDRRYERRALDADELCYLVASVENGPMWRRSLNGQDRAMLYRVAAGTGFRVGELGSLTPSSFHLDTDPPAIALQAASSKRRRNDLQPIRDDLAELLRGWLVDKPADQPVWPGHWHDQGAEMVRADLRRARARWIRETTNRDERRARRASGFLAEVDSTGRVVDFHAFRVTYITLLVKGGESVKVVQELARHSTPVLTLGVYTKLGVHDLSKALSGLPSLTGGAPARERMRATGTDHTQPLPAGSEDAQQQRVQKCRQNEREGQRPGAASRIVASAAGMPTGAHKPLSHAEKREIVRGHTTCGGTATGRIRTGDLRFTKPLLCQLSYGGKLSYAPAGLRLESTMVRRTIPPSAT